MELQLKMAACSINHEYARMEFDEVDDLGAREELLDYMHDCRNEYLQARTALLLMTHTPSRSSRRIL